MTRICLLFAVFVSSLVSGKTVYFVEIGAIDNSKYFYDYSFYRDEVSKPFVLLREALERAGFEVKFTRDGEGMRDVAAVVSINDTSKTLLANMARISRGKKILLVMEPPVVLPALHDPRLRYQFGKIFTLFDDSLDGLNYFKFYYPQPRMEMIDRVTDFDQKKLCALINGNKSFEHPKALYGERRKAISFFSGTSEFDLYGPDWAGYSAWRGYVSSKWETLKDYKFCICYENMGNQRGYITEKIFDAFIAGCVPIYLGATNISDYIPSECFIDRTAFVSEYELYQYMKNMDRETYERYLDAIGTFLKGPQAHLFSTEYFVERMLKVIQESAQIPY